MANHDAPIPSLDLLIDRVLREDPITASAQDFKSYEDGTTAKIVWTLRHAVADVPGLGAKDRARSLMYQAAADLDRPAWWRRPVGTVARGAIVATAAIFVALVARDSDFAGPLRLNTIHSGSIAPPGTAELALVDLDARTATTFLASGRDSAASTTTQRIAASVVAAQRSIEAASSERARSDGFERMVASATATMSELEAAIASLPQDAIPTAQSLSATVGGAYASSIEKLKTYAPDADDEIGSLTIEFEAPKDVGPVRLTAYRVGPNGGAWIDAKVISTNDSNMAGRQVRVEASLPAGVYTRLRVGVGWDQTANLTRPLFIQSDQATSVHAYPLTWQAARGAPDSGSPNAGPTPAENAGMDSGTLEDGDGSPDPSQQASPPPAAFIAHNESPRESRARNNETSESGSTAGPTPSKPDGAAGPAFQSNDQPKPQLSERDSNVDPLGSQESASKPPQNASGGERSAGVPNSPPAAGRSGTTPAAQRANARQDLADSEGDGNVSQDEGQGVPVQSGPQPVRPVDPNRSGPPGHSGGAKTDKSETKSDERHHATEEAREAEPPGQPGNGQQARRADERASQEEGESTSPGSSTKQEHQPGRPNDNERPHNGKGKPSGADSSDDGRGSSSGGEEHDALRDTGPREGPPQGKARGNEDAEERHHGKANDGNGKSQGQSRSKGA